MVMAHNLGFPRLGANREMKRAVEAYWKGEIGRVELDTRGREIRERHWEIQMDAGLDLIPVGDFSWYDHVLDTAVMFGVVPERFGGAGESVDLDTYFRMARGDEQTAPCEMTKWFDTNYHYLVPELRPDQEFRLDASKLLGELAEARELGVPAKPVVLGPLTFLWLAKPAGEDFDRLSLLDRLVPYYGKLFAELAEAGAEWVEIDEPVIGLDLPQPWREAIESAYNRFGGAPINRLLATYFSPVADNLNTVCFLPINALHIDAVRGAGELQQAWDMLPAYKYLSVGAIDGRNVWRADLEAELECLEQVYQQVGDRLWIAPSCSLLHCPMDLELETDLDDELKSWLAFSVQKLDEVVTLRRAVAEGRDAVADDLAASREAAESRRSSPRIHNPKVRERMDAVTPEMMRRDSAYAERAEKQSEALDLPDYPTTTIGSFPQTVEIRKARREYRAGRLSREDYQAGMREEIERCIRAQEAIGLDVLAHGEPERNDMVEYFGELLDGFAFTRHGWVQSYGSRGVKPPIIYGDVARPEPMTVDWIRYAQSLTDKPVKGMLTGPVTIVQWSFVRDDQPREDTAKQIALALRDELSDLEAAGIGIIQVDEPAMREGLPLRQSQWKDYLRWAVEAFRLATSGVADGTQIHTHMCYAEFNDIIESIAELDADVITLESSRSRMELLDAFREFDYPNEIGPGVYDIHSPRVPDADEMADLLQRARRFVPAERLWVNPDCGLKTRDWEQIEPALRNMVAAAQQVRERASA